MMPNRPSETCPYCHGNGEVIITRDPDVDMPCVCTDPLIREWCHARHTCHHWWEDECTEACDRGEHNHPIGARECTDPLEEA